MEVLRQHLPISCNVFLGGYLFNLGGDESKQIDIIVSDSLSLRFDALNKDGGGKSFACVDGAIAALSIKSHLNKNEMVEALENIASIPPGTPLDRTNADPHVDFTGMTDGMLKVIFALDGASVESTGRYLNDFYSSHPEIPINRRPNYIHVLGKYTWVRLLRDTRNDAGTIDQAGVYCSRHFDADLFFLSSLITSIETISRFHRHIFYNYTKIFELAVPPAEGTDQGHAT